MATVYQKRGVWYVGYKDGRALRRLVRTTAETKTEAKRLALELERGAERQRLGLEEVPSDCKFTLAELCEWWLKNRCPPGRANNERHRLKKHILIAPVGATPVPRITAAAIEDVLRGMERRGLSASTVNGIRGTLHTVFSRARKARVWAGSNPIEEVERRKVPRKIHDTLRAEEIPVLLQHVPDSWRDLFATAIYTGMRKGELFGLRKSDIDARALLIYVRRSYDQETTKGKHADVIPIAQPLVPYLANAWRAAPDGGLLFPDEHGKMRTSEADPQKVLRHAMARAGLVDGYEHVCRRCKAAGRKPCSERHGDADLRLCGRCGMKLWPQAVHRKMRFHDVRHSVATLLLRAGVDVHRVQRILRHKDVNLTAGTYAHLQVEDLRAAVNLLPSSEGGEKMLPRATRLLPEGESAGKATAAALEISQENRGRPAVGETGFEPATPWSRTKCSTRLSHSPRIRPRPLRGVPRYPVCCSKSIRSSPNRVCLAGPCTSPVWNREWLR
jgi:integrase